MKLTLLALASTAISALAAPAGTVEKRADYCGQWDNQVAGTYTIYNVCHILEKGYGKSADP
jgi:xyloglucan-specific endo-beta-1,4-glucanase